MEEPPPPPPLPIIDNDGHERFIVTLRRSCKTSFIGKSYLSDRLIQVRMTDTLSTATIISGVSQGAVLGPSLFLVHFRRIPEAMSPSQTSLFADTMAFLENCSGKQTSPCCDLGKHLRSLLCWATSNNVDFNAAKSADLVVGPSHHRRLASA